MSSSLETWQQTYRTKGAVEIKSGRGQAVVTILIALAFIVGGAAFLAVLASDLPERLVGLASLVLGLVGLAAGLKLLIRPILIVRLDGWGLQMPRKPPIPWQEVLAVEQVTVRPGASWVVVQTGEGYAGNLAAPSGRRWRPRSARPPSVEVGVVELMPSPDDAGLEHLIRWAHEQATSPSPDRMQHD